MPKCGSCGSESTRIRSRWSDKGDRLPDECSHCAPGAFEGKFTAPSDKKIWMGYEARPNEYVKADDGGYDRKPEYRAEQEARLSQETEDEREARLKAEAHKRATRRTLPMDTAEIVAAVAKAEQYAKWIQEGLTVN